MLLQKHFVKITHTCTTKTGFVIVTLILSPELLTWLHWRYSCNKWNL